MAKSPKIILFDIETSFMLTRTFTLYPEAINPNGIVKDWFMICAAWKELGKKKIHATSINDFKRESSTDDRGVVETLANALADADIIIGHNSDAFDIKKLNSRIIYHRLPPLPKIIQLDTLKEVRKVAKFSSHKLDYLGKILLGHGKLPTSSGLWDRATDGDRAAVREMVKYNKVDVLRLEEIYNVLLPYMKSHPHVGAYTNDRNMSCKHCGSTDIKKNGYRFTASGLKKQEIQCKSCHSYSLIPLEK
jgi:DNA polymerase elongation subunit (family B)